MSKKKPSRGDRWSEAATAAKEAVSGAQDLIEEYRTKIEELVDEKRTELETAVTDLMQELQDKLDLDAVNNALSDLKDVQSEYEDWQSNLPDNLRDNSPVGEKLTAVCEFDFNTELELETSCEVSVEWDLGSNVDDVISVIEEAEGADLPLGFGRD